MRWVLRTLLLLLLSAGIGAGALLFFSPDPRYRAAEWISLGRYARYDSLIADVARKYEIDPMLLKAVIWRESEFHPNKTGTSGERGLMQVGEAAAADWARAEKIETFVPTDLFSPRTNVEVGAWYLKRALKRWKGKDDPVPFALAEYNAGKSRVNRWIASSKSGEKVGADEFRAAIDIPSTRLYVATILKRYDHYRRQAQQ